MKIARVMATLSVSLACAVSRPGPSPAGSPALPSDTSADQPQATVYYVRPDVGTAQQCTGRADAAYPASGSAQAYAWDHPFRALPPGSYRLGYGAPACSASAHP